MADFETCYFCGAGPNEALGEFGVVPSAFAPTDDEQRSVVLCASCREKLTAVMDAAVAASRTGNQGAVGQGAGGQGAGGQGAGGQDAGGQASGSGGAGGSDPAGTRGSTGQAGPADSPGGTIEPANATGDDDIVDARPGGEEPTTEAGPGGEEPTTEAGPGGEEPTTDADGSTGGGTEPEATSGGADESGGDEDEDADFTREQGAGVSFSTATAGDELPEDADDEEETVPQRETGAESVDPGIGTTEPDDAEAYRQVIRLLQNREFPVNRNEIAEVAASAYQLSPTETQSAIDTIVRKGMLVEDDGVLRRPDGG